jgi:hypothetical protein
MTTSADRTPAGSLTHRLPDLELERGQVLAPELRIGGVQRKAPATNVATM